MAAVRKSGRCETYVGAFRSCPTRTATPTPYGPFSIHPGDGFVRQSTGEHETWCVVRGAYCVRLPPSRITHYESAARHEAHEGDRRTRRTVDYFDAALRASLRMTVMGRAQKETP